MPDSQVKEQKGKQGKANLFTDAVSDKYLIISVLIYISCTLVVH